LVYTGENDYYLINSNIVGNSGSLYKCATSTEMVCTDVTSTANPGYYLDAAGNKQIISCTGDVGSLTCTSATAKIGYYKNVDTGVSSYIECASGANCVAIDDATLSSTVAGPNTIGHLTTEGKLYLGESGKFAEFGVTTNYLVLYHRNGIFHDVISTSLKYGIITATTNSMIINENIVSGISICFDSDKKVTLSSDTENYATCTAAGGTIYASCDNSHVCYDEAPSCNVSSGDHCKYWNHY